MDIELLDEYYEDCVIGGPAAFVVPVKDRDKFVEAIRTKLVLEIAGLAPSADTRDQGLRRQSARLLHDRRAAVAGALGELGLAGLLGPIAIPIRPQPEEHCEAMRLEGPRSAPSFETAASQPPQDEADELSHEMPDHLDMRGVFELIDRRHAFEPVAAGNQQSRHRARRWRRCRTPRSRSGISIWRSRAPAPPPPDAADRTRSHRSLRARSPKAGRETDRAVAR